MIVLNWDEGRGERAGGWSEDWDESRDGGWSGDWDEHWDGGAGMKAEGRVDTRTGTML